MRKSAQTAFPFSAFSPVLFFCFLILYRKHPSSLILIFHWIIRNSHQTSIISSWKLFSSSHRSLFALPFCSFSRFISPEQFFSFISSLIYFIGHPVQTAIPVTQRTFRLCLQNRHSLFTSCRWSSFPVDYDILNLLINSAVSHGGRPKGWVVCKK